MCIRVRPDISLPLFLVFVAVDVRWLRQALLEEYRGQINNLDEGRAKTSGYLEKIFQIPYWIRPFSPTATASALEKRMGPIDSSGDAPAEEAPAISFGAPGPHARTSGPASTHAQPAAHEFLTAEKRKHRRDCGDA